MLVVPGTALETVGNRLSRRQPLAMKGTRDRLKGAKKRRIALSSVNEGEHASLGRAGMNASSRDRSPTTEKGLQAG
jgi:hypothetical protein